MTRTTRAPRYRSSKLVYVGFLDGRPHVQVELGARVIATYVSKVAAKRAYADVRTTRLVFDADWLHALNAQSKGSAHGK